MLHPPIFSRKTLRYHDEAATTLIPSPTLAAPLGGGLGVLGGRPASGAGGGLPEAAASTRVTVSVISLSALKEAR
jgi:hypothetical protein